MSTRHFTRTWVMAALFGAGMGFAVAGEWQPSNYEQRFVNPDDNGTYLKDNNVWVYSREFATRFGMPQKWISDELKGAEAVAYRVEWSSLQRCGYFGEADNCRPIERCVMDVYLTDMQSDKLPWKDDKSIDFIHRQSSRRFLTTQRREDARSWDPGEKRWDISRANVGLDSLSWVSGPPTDDKVYSESSGAVSVLAYDRTIFEGLDFIQLAVSCNVARREEGVRIFFTEKFPNRTDYGVSYEELVEKKTDKAIKFLKIKRDWGRHFKSGSVPHVVALPDGYMARVNEYDRAEYQPKSLANEAIKRFEGKDKDQGGDGKSWWQKLFGTE